MRHLLKYARAAGMGLSLAVLAAAFGTPVAAHEYTVGTLYIEHPWSRTVEEGAPSAAGYLRIENRGSQPERLTGAESPAAERTILHQSRMKDGMMEMIHVEAVEIPPGGSVAFEPGGYHVMFKSPRRPFTEGARIPLTLHFARAGAVQVEVVVKAATAGGSGHMNH